MVLQAHGWRNEICCPGYPYPQEDNPGYLCKCTFFSASHAMRAIYWYSKTRLECKKFGCSGVVGRGLKPQTPSDQKLPCSALSVFRIFSSKGRMRGISPKTAAPKTLCASRFFTIGSVDRANQLTNTMLQPCWATVVERVCMGMLHVHVFYFELSRPPFCVPIVSPDLGGQGCCSLCGSQPIVSSYLTDAHTHIGRERVASRASCSDKSR